jgi:hypothetical protein
LSFDAINQFIGEENEEPPDKMSLTEIIAWNYLIDVSESIPSNNIALTLALLIVNKMPRPI